MAAVHVADLIVPGVWLEKDPSWTDDTARDVERWLRALPDELDRCAVALGLFEGAKHDSMPPHEEWEREINRRRIHEEALVAAGVTLSYDAMRLRVEMDLRRADWKIGVTPGAYRRALPFMYAELFVAHVDMILKLVKKVSKAAPSHSAKLEHRT